MSKGGEGGVWEGGRSGSAGATQSAGFRLLPPLFPKRCEALGGDWVRAADKELRDDLGCPVPSHGNLEKWSHQVNRKARWGSGGGVRCSLI